MKTLDKNVGNVDIDELRKAREELDRERGVETDPNMYNNYNPNRANEEAQQIATEINQDALEDSHNLEEEMLSSGESVENISDSGTSDDALEILQMLGEITENSADGSNGETATAEFDNANTTLSEEPVATSQDELSNSVDVDLSVDTNDSEMTINVEAVGEDVPQPQTQESQNTSSGEFSEISGDVDFSVYDNFSDFEVEANKNIVSEPANAIAEDTEETETTEAENIGEDEGEVILFENAYNSDHEDKDDTKISDTEAEIADKIAEISDSEQSNSEENTEEDLAMESSEESNETETEADIKEKLDDKDEIAKLEAQIAELRARVAENEQTEEEVENADAEMAENYSSDAEDDYDAINSLMDSLEGLKPVDLTEEEKREIDEKRKDDELQIIDDYKKLERLDRILGEQEEEEQEVVVEQAPKIYYPEIEPIDFVDIISTEEFKSVDNLSYILGKDELGKIHYGNLRDFYNMVIFAKENNVALSAVHSILVSLILKNSTSDINFVICDSKADSKLQVYNKSSYMYFNRLAKTNKEILDTLIEISKELEERYKILVSAGVKSIEQYNIISKNDNLKPLPYIVTVFNNYSKSMQLADSDKINTILYQILKLGRVVGLYLIIVGNMKVKSDDINYNLPTRLSFKMSDDEESLSMLGESTAECLETDDEFLLSSLDTSKLVHLKVPSISVKEVEVLIKNIEE